MELGYEPLEYSLISPTGAPDSPLISPPNSPPNSRPIEFESNSSPLKDNGKKGKKSIRGTPKAAPFAVKKSKACQTELSGAIPPKKRKEAKKEKGKKRVKGYPIPDQSKVIIPRSNFKSSSPVDDAKNRMYIKASRFIAVEFSKFVLSKLVTYQ